MKSATLVIPDDRVRVRFALWSAGPGPFGPIAQSGQSIREDRSMRVLVPLPDRDFDITEVAVPWRLLTEAGHRSCSRPSAAGGAGGDPGCSTG